jgi:hypothetical protein
LSFGKRNTHADRIVVGGGTIGMGFGAAPASAGVRAAPMSAAPMPAAPAASAAAMGDQLNGSPVDAAWLVLEAANDLGDEPTVEACRRIIDASLNGKQPPQADLNLVTDYFR